MSTIDITEEQLGILKKYSVLDGESNTFISERMNSGLASLNLEHNAAARIRNKLGDELDITEIEELDYCLEAILGNIDEE